jgi:hypothetical protein
MRAFVLQSGGVKQPPRRRPPGSLLAAELEEISRGVAAGDSCRAIAKRLGRAPSTVSRELTRNGGCCGYRAQRADLAAGRRAGRPKPCKLVVEPRLREVVEDKLGCAGHRSRSQAGSRWPIPTTQPCGSRTRPLPQPVRPTPWGAPPRATALPGQLAGQFATRRASTCLRPGQLPDTIPISQRPAEANGRVVPGHWEGDLVLGRRPSAVLTPGRADQPSGPAGRPAGRLAGRLRPPGPDRSHGSAPRASVSLADLGPRQGHRDQAGTKPG